LINTKKTQTKQRKNDGLMCFGWD